MIPTKKFFIVSLGPGGSGHVTLDALDALCRSQVIFVTTKDAQRSLHNSRSFEIIKKVSEYSKKILQHPLQIETEPYEKNTCQNSQPAKIIPLYHPMNYSKENWRTQSAEILSALENYNMVSYTTIGDAAIYSTAYFLLAQLQQHEKNILDFTEVIPGITSFSLASAKIKKPLCVGSSSLRVTPFTPSQNETTVYMRPPKNQSYNMLAQNPNLYTFTNLTLCGEKIQKGAPQTSDGYMQLLIDFFE